MDRPGLGHSDALEEVSLLAQARFIKAGVAELGVTDPIVLGEAVNTATTYGYDPVTQMQETKTTLCRIEKA